MADHETAGLGKGVLRSGRLGIVIGRWFTVD
jgi:hypothetical protein